MKLSNSLLCMLMICPLAMAGGDKKTAIAAAVHSEERSDKDTARDANRQPGEILVYFGITPGMTVLDLFSGGGYYTEILSRIVGDDGEVIAHNNDAYMAYVDAEVTERYGQGRLDNVRQVTVEANELELESGSVDAVLAVLTWHDFYYVDEANNWPKINAAKVVETLCSATRSGAVLGLVDHVAVAGSDPWDSAQKLHRIDPQKILSDLDGSCFEFVGENDILRNPEDDLVKSMGDPAIRGKTDRVVYKFRRN